MENNENNVQNQVNEVQKKNETNTNYTNNGNKKVTISLLTIILLLVLVIGIGGGYLLSIVKNNTINEVNAANTTNNPTEAKTGKKLDDSKPWVYDLNIEQKEFEFEYEGKKDKYSASKTFKVPYININSEDAKAVNEKILEVYNNAIQNFGKDNRIMTGIEYHSYENRKYISIVLTETFGYVNGSGSKVGEYAYTFNTDTLKLATFKEVYKEKGYEENNIEERINKFVERAKKDVSGGPQDNNSSVYFNNDFYIDEYGKIKILIANKHIEWDKTVLTYLTYDIDDTITNQNDNDSNQLATNKKVTNVTSKIINEDKGRDKQLIVTGLNSAGATVWEYTTLKENYPEQIVNEGLKLIGTRNSKVYVCDWGKLYILDEQTGKVLAKNTSAGLGAATTTTFDNDGNLFTIAYLSGLNVFDKDAKLVKRIWNLDASYRISGVSLYVNDRNQLVLSYESDESVVATDNTKVRYTLTFELNDLLEGNIMHAESIAGPTSIGWFKEVERFQLNQDGKLYLCPSNGTKLKQKYGEEKLIGENVFKIYKVSIGNSVQYRLVMVMKDGSIKYIDETAELEGDVIVKDTNVKNAESIVTVQSQGGHDYTIIDKEGRTFKNENH